MLAELTQKARIFELMHEIDRDLSDKCKQSSCKWCGGRLHQANYERKPRGGPANLPESYAIRHSLCCGSCRRRTKPPSLLFWQRRVYWGCVIMVVLTLRQNRSSGYSTGKLMKMFGVGRNTIKSWVLYFRRTYPKSGGWQRIRGRLSGLIANDRLPGDVVELFLESRPDGESGLVGCLGFLATGGVFSAIA